MNSVSLFAGVGGFDLALQRAGVKVVSAVEIDKHAQKVLSKQFPVTAIHSDIKEVTGDQLRADGFRPEDGIITGGFPCQDLSVAGARQGLAGERSGLFWQIIRLTDELKPKWLILENVPGLLSSNKGRDMGIVIGALVDRGYGVCWRVLDAQHFGVAQRRRRLFIVCCLGDHRRPVEVLFEPESGIRHPAPRRKKGQDFAGVTEASTYSNNRVMPTILERDYKGLNSDDVENGKYVWSDKITFARMQALGQYEIDNTASTLKARDYKSETDLVFRKARRAQSVTDDETWVPDDKSNTLNTFDLGDVRATTAVVGFSHTQGLDAQPMSEMIPTLRREGNGMAVIMRNREGKDGGGKGPLLSDKSLTIATNNDQTLFTTSTVRRLTPVECERLQGFPDDWTSGQADGQRYKQMGNAVAVPVVQWIVKRLVRLDSNE